MTQPTAPGIYIDEINSLPASVAPVATSIPAFIGYTEKAQTATQQHLTNKPTRITSYLEYTDLFGGPPSPKIDVEVTAQNQVNFINPSSSSSSSNFLRPTYVMAYSLQMFFANGGGTCYIVSVGDYTETISEQALQQGLKTLEKEEEPTLLVFPDARGISSSQEFYQLYQSALAQCENMKNRFTIIDTYNDEGNGSDTACEVLRNELSSNYLDYGAVYYPSLQTTLNLYYQEANVTVTYPSSSSSSSSSLDSSSSSSPDSSSSSSLDSSSSSSSDSSSSSSEEHKDK